MSQSPRPVQHRVVGAILALALACAALVVGGGPASAAALPLPAGDSLYYLSYFDARLTQVTGVSSGTLTTSSVCAGTCSAAPTPTMGGFYDEATDSIYAANGGFGSRFTLLRVPLSGPSAGAYTVVGSDGSLDVFGIAHGPEGTFALTPGGGNPQLVSVDLATAALTPIGHLNVEPNGIMYAFTYDRVSGRYYAMERSNGNLYTVDVTTGAATLVGSTGLSGGYSIMADGDGTVWVLTPSSVLWSFTVTGSTIGTPVNRGALSGFATVSMVIKSPIPSYTVAYDGNGSDGGTAPVDASSPYDSGSTVTVKSPGTLTRTGYQFWQWLTTPTWQGGVTQAYAPDATFAIAADTTLYARWGGGPLEFRTDPAGSATSSIAFPPTLSGSTSSLTVYVRNTGAVSVPISNVSGNGSGVSRTGGTCSSGGGSIAPYAGGANADCTYIFSWTSSGGSLSYDFGVQYFRTDTVTLTGTSTVPDVTPPTVTGPTGPTYVPGSLDLAQYTADESATWSLTGANASSFTIAADGTLSFVSTPAPGTYTVQVVATDAADNSRTTSVTVTVPDVTSPVVTGPAEPPYVPGSLELAQYTADEHVTWTVEGTDAASFAVAADGTLSFASQPASGTYRLLVVASDASDNSSSLAVTVVVPAPSGPSRVKVDVRGSTAVVTVVPGSSSGVPVTSTLVRLVGTSLSCTVPAGASTCTLRGLPSRERYDVSATSYGATGRSATVTVTVTLRTVGIRGAVYFGATSSTLSSESRERLRALVAKVPSRGRLVSCAVLGYVQSSRFGMDVASLSGDRAASVASYLRAKGVVAPMTAAGRGVLGTTRWSRATVVTMTYVVQTQSSPLT